MPRKWFHQFTIDRGTWACGGVDTALKNKNGTKCCIGFLAESCGVKEFTLVTTLRKLDEYDRALVQGKCPSLVQNSPDYAGGLVDACDELYSTNDDSALTPADRERKLKQLFADEGVRVLFTGKYPRD